MPRCWSGTAGAANNSDAAIGVEPLVHDDTIGGQVRALGDSAYGTGGALDALAGADHLPVNKPWPLHPAVAGGFTADDFTGDEATDTATRPHGVTRPISGTRAVTFDAACRGCPLRQRCTSAADGRTLHLHRLDPLQRAHRARAADPQVQATYRRHRPMVERSLARLTRGHRRVTNRGVAGTTPGCTCGPPRSTSAACSPSDSPAPPAPGRSPLDRHHRTDHREQRAGRPLCRTFRC